MDTKVLLLLEALLKNFNTFYEVLLLQMNLELSNELNYGIRSVPPRTIPPHQFPPGQFPPGQFPPRSIAPWTIPP